MPENYFLPIKDGIINETNILDHSPCLELYDVNLNHLFGDTA